MTKKNVNKNCQPEHHSTNDTLDDCILIEHELEVIEILDITDDVDLEKTLQNGNNEQMNSLNLSNKTLEEGEIVEIPIAIVENKTNNVLHKNEINVKNSIKNVPKQTLSYFFEDVSSEFNMSDIPLYDIVSNNKTLVPKNENKFDNISDIDDSVIFVGEEIDLDKFEAKPKVQQYISITNDECISNPPLKRSPTNNLENLIRPFKKFKDLNYLQNIYKTPTKTTVSNSALLTANDFKRFAEYNTNTYNPNKDLVKKPGKRMIIIDGCNVAYGHSCNKEFSVKGLQICLEYFEKMGHEVKAVVPQLRLQRSKSTDPETLEKLYRKGKIVFTPCKNLPGKSSISYDDRFILQLAAEFDGAIVSNDNYRDLLNENEALKKIIQNRVIGYSWCNDMFMLPKDPYGRNGPSLNTILNRS